MTREEAKIYFEQCNSKIISVCKDENKYDCEKQEIISDYARKTYEANRLALEALEQEPKTGHWIRVDETKVKCSECEVIHLIAQYPMGEIKFCPNCGTKMIESEVKQ